MAAILCGGDELIGTLNQNAHIIFDYDNGMLSKISSVICRPFCSGLNVFMNAQITNKMCVRQII